MKKKKLVEITSLEQFEETYLPENKNGRYKNIAPYDYGVRLANQAIEKFQTLL